MRAAILAIVMLARFAYAEGDAAKAKALFAEGRALIESSEKLGDPAAKAAKLESACQKFAASLALDPQLGTQLNLGDCRARQGNLVDAYAIFHAAADTAVRTHDRAAFVQKQVAALAGKLVKVTLHVGEPERAGLVVELAGRSLPREGWQRVQVAEPGTVVVRASAPGRIAVTIRREAAAGAELAIEVPGLDPEHAAVVVVPPNPPPEPVKLAPRPPSEIVPPAIFEPEPSRAGWYVGGAGALLLAASLGLAVDARLRYNNALTPLDVDAANSAVHQSDIATGVGIAGAVTAVIGVILIVRAYHHGSHGTIAVTADSVGFEF
jgi:hypothetical protein